MELVRRVIGDVCGALLFTIVVRPQRVEVGRESESDKATASEKIKRRKHV